MHMVFGRWTSCQILHSPNTAKSLITYSLNITQETAKQCISSAPLLPLLLWRQVLSKDGRNGLLFVWKKVVLKMMGMVVFTGSYIIFSQSICSTSPATYPPLPASSSTRVTSSNTPQPTTDCDTKSTSEILPVVSSSSQQDDLIQSTQPVTEFMTSSNASQSSRTVSRSISTTLFMMFGRTRWRLLNSLFVLAVATAKSVSAYQNASTAANSLDLVIGLVWALM
jgi:hypothetical protein